MRLTPHGESNTDQRALPTLLGRDEREFLGGSERAEEVSMAAVFRAAIETAAGPLFRLGAVERGARPRRDYRNGYYERDLVTRFGTIRLRIARTRGKSFLPCGLRPFQRRAEEVAILIRAAFLRGISTRQAGRVVATLTGEVVSPQTVSKLTRDLDQAVREFHQARLDDDYGYLFLDGLSLRVRRPAGGKRVEMLGGYGGRRGRRRALV